MRSTLTISRRWRHRTRRTRRSTDLLAPVLNSHASLRFTSIQPIVQPLATPVPSSVQLWYKFHEYHAQYSVVLTTLSPTPHTHCSQRPPPTHFLSQRSFPTILIAASAHHTPSALLTGPDPGPALPAQNLGSTANYPDSAREYSENLGRAGAAAVAGRNSADRTASAAEEGVAAKGTAAVAEG